MDEVVITIRGKKHWLWRAVDRQGYRHHHQVG
jgi:putative transposase